MPVINGVYLKDFAALPSAVDDANIIPIAISGNQVAYRTTVSGIITDARITGKLLTGLSVTGTAILATDTILQAFGKVQNQLNNRVSSVGLTMPVAFSVANSPVTGSGTLAVTAVGAASQYIRGDGQLADFPTTGGGGSSVSYYLNGSISQGTIGGNAYYEMNKTPVIGAGTNFTIAADGYIAQFITDANDPNSLLIPAGNWNVEMYFSASSSGGTPSFYVEVYKYNGTTFTLLGSSSATPEGITNGTAIDIYYTSVGIPETVLAITDRLAIRVYVTHSGRTITLHTEDNHLSEIVTTFSNGLTALNGLTKQAQYFAVGSTGTDFNISSVTDTHTFNIPNASASNRGLITTGTQTIAGAKTFADNLTLSKNLYLTKTSSTVGVIYQESVRFLHTYKDPSSANYNLFLGYEAGNFTNSTIVGQNSNIGIGTNALNGLTSGDGNIYIGSPSGGSITSGNRNTIIGTGVSGITTGSGNTIIGYYPTPLSASTTNNIIITSGGTIKAQHDGTNWSLTGTVSSTDTGTGFSSIASTPLFGNTGNTNGINITLQNSGGQVLFGADNSTGSITGLSYGNYWIYPGTSSFSIYRNGAGLVYTVDSSGNHDFKTGTVTFGSTLSNGTYTYTLPSATGTLALTSALGSYLPLTGGTLTGGLSGTTASFNDATVSNTINITTSGVGRGLSISKSGDNEALIIVKAGGSGNAVTISGGTTSLEALSGTSATFSSATAIGLTAGDIQYNSNAGYGILSANSTRVLSISNAGVNIPTLTGTSATFSGALSGTTALFTNSANNYSLKLLNSGGYPAIIDLSTTTATSTARNWAIYTNGTNWGDLEFRPSAANGGDPYTTGTVALRIASTGAATFSSSITTASPSGGTAKPFKIGNVATVTPTSQNRTIEIEIDGTTYYLTAKTTNN